MGVNLGAIVTKLNSYVKSQEGQRRIEGKIKEYRLGSGSGLHSGKTQGGGDLLTYNQMQDAARELIAMIRKHAASANLPESVLANVESFCDSPLVVNDDGSAKIEVNMMSSAHRESLLPDDFPRGSDNIVAAFNRGYSAKGAVYGTWESRGTDTWSLRSRQGLYFLQSAIREFNSKYGEKYDVTVTLDSIYE